MFDSFAPSFTPAQMLIKLPIAAVIEIAKGERPSNPAPSPLVSAFADNATPKMTASPQPISPD